MNEWQNLRWGDIATLEYGKALRGYSQTGGSVPVFGTNGPIGTTDTALSNDATVIVGRKGAYRGIHYSPSPCFVIDTAFYLVPRVDMDMRWAYYELLTHDINSMDSGSAIPSTSRDDFYSLPVQFPPPEAQHVIANILGKLDDKIELNQQMNQTLDEIARTLFRSWFVDFDPVRAKMKGRQQHGMAAETAFLLPNRLVDSKLGPIPEGWEIKRLGEVAALSRQTISPNKHIDEQFDHYSLPAFDKRKVPVREGGGQIASNKTIVPQGAVLISKLNPHIPRVWLTDVGTDARSIASTEFMVLNAQPGISRNFLYCLLKSDSFQEQFRSQVTGTTGSHQRVTPDSLLSISVLVPPQVLEQTFRELVEPLQNLFLLNLAESESLTDARDALLLPLLSGALLSTGKVRI